MMNVSLSLLRQIVISPGVLAGGGIIIFALYLFKPGTNFLDVKKVFKDYFSIFSKAKIHIAFFWGLPFIFALALIQETILTAELSESLLVFLSIFISALFAMLAILVQKQEHNLDTAYQRILIETASVALFEIILCVFSLLVTVSMIFIGRSCADWLAMISSFLDYYLIFAILILVKRLKALIDNP